MIFQSTNSHVINAVDTISGLLVKLLPVQDQANLLNYLLTAHDNSKLTDAEAEAAQSLFDSLTTACDEDTVTLAQEGD